MCKQSKIVNEIYASVCLYHVTARHIGIYEKQAAALQSVIHFTRQVITETDPSAFVQVRCCDRFYTNINMMLPIKMF